MLMQDIRDKGYSYVQGAKTELENGAFSCPLVLPVLEGTLLEIARERQRMLWREG